MVLTEHWNKLLDELRDDMHEWTDYKFAILDHELNERFKNWDLGNKMKDCFEDLKFPVNYATERIVIFGSAAFHVSEKGVVKGIDPYDL